MSKTRFFFSLSFAIFSMFFGAGNIVFPLGLGYATQDKNLWACLGLIITGVLVPLAGLLSMLLYHGNYTKFFSRIGKVPGLVIVILILLMIGPFGAIPRCIAISHSTLTSFDLCPAFLHSTLIFGIASVLLIFLFSYRLNKVITILGNYLTPLLLFFITVILVKGYIGHTPLDATSQANSTAFFKGIFSGYNTMDLLAAFFFSSCIVLCLKKEKAHTSLISPLVIGASIFAIFLLALIYVGFAQLSAFYQSDMPQVQTSQLLGMLASHIMGPYAGFVAAITVVLACVTTEIALSIVCAEFLHEITKKKISYVEALIATLVISCIFSLFHFQGISALISPVLEIIYPALILLVFLNMIPKASNRLIQWFFYTTVIGTVILNFIIKN